MTGDNGGSRNVNSRKMQDLEYGKPAV